MGSYNIDEQHMLYKAHDAQVDASLDLPQTDIQILRELGKTYAEIAALPVQQEKKTLWTKLNDLNPVRPLVWINEVCWEQMDVDGELTLTTQSEVARRLETLLRRTIYQWKHMPGDMVVDSVIYAPFIIDHPGIGIQVEADFPAGATGEGIISRHFANQIQSEDDIAKITTPTIRHDAERSQAFLQAYREIFAGILDVQQKGSPGFWFSPWDDIVFWMGADAALLNLAMEPDMMHRLITHVVDVYMNILDQFEAQGLLGLNNCNWRVGSGAYGYTKDLPEKKAQQVNVCDIWGAAAPQIFGSVSPQMHKEFSIDVEKKYLNRFGLLYYGCCEPLSERLDLLADLPNLRKISISPWANVARAAEGMRNKYVMSLKPSPSIFASSGWDADYARKELTSKLQEAKGCNVEIVMKDISTVLNEPHRLWEWAKIANEVVQGL